MDPFFLCLHFVPSHVYSSSELFAWWFWILQTMHSNLGNTWDDKNKPTNMFRMVGFSCEIKVVKTLILVGDLPWYFFSVQWTMLHQSDVHMGMDQYLLIPFLVGWTSIYQLFWCSPGVQGFDPLPYDIGNGQNDLQRRFFFSLGGKSHPSPFNVGQIPTQNANTAWMCYGFTTWISSVHQESIRVNGWVG